GEVALQANRPLEHGQQVAAVVAAGRMFALKLPAIQDELVTSDQPLDLGPKGINVIRRSDGSKAVLALEGQPTALLPLWQLPWLQVLRVTPGAEGTAGMARFVAGGTLLAEEPLNALSP
ncbi:MAG TPA: hypothetical protein PLG21_19285, partial [Anaerolineae bacterium]|nr:hypothetical protein [Anaerolineae bacterium]